MSENAFDFLKYTIIFLCLGLWFIGGGAKVGQMGVLNTENRGVVNTASVYTPEVHYQTIILE